MIDELRKSERTPTPKKLLDGFVRNLQDIKVFMSRVRARQEEQKKEPGRFAPQSVQQTQALEWLKREVKNSAEVMQSLHDLIEREAIDPQYLRQSATALKRLENVFRRARRFFYERDDEPDPSPDAA